MSTNGDDQKKNNDERGAEWIGIGTALGAGIGVVLGAVFDSTGVGISIGAGLGIIFGAAMMSARQQEDEDNESEEA